MLQLGIAPPWPDEPETTICSYRGEDVKQEVYVYIFAEITQLAGFFNAKLSISDEEIARTSGMIQQYYGQSLSLEDVKRWTDSVRLGFIHVPVHGKVVYDKTYQNFNGEVIMNWVQTYIEAKTMTREEIEKKRRDEKMKESAATLEQFYVGDPGISEGDLSAIHASYAAMEKDGFKTVGLRKVVKLELTEEQKKARAAEAEFDAQCKQIRDSWPMLSGKEKLEIVELSKANARLLEFVRSLV